MAGEKDLEKEGLTPVIKDPRIVKKSIRPLLIFIITTIFLGTGFYNNQWRSADRNKFEDHQLDTEGFVIGRMVKARRDGLFSLAGLPGNVAGRQIKSQYEAYYQNLDFDFFVPYYSQIGFQGMTLSFFDRIIPFTGEKKIKIFKMLKSLLFAATLAIIVLWCYREFGLASAATVVITTIFSQWMTMFGRNLWWSMWAFYLPFITTLFVLKKKKRTSWTSILTFAAVFIKCSYNGYEYITTTIIMMLTPYIYYGIFEGWGVKRLTKKISIAAITAISAVLSSTAILTYQIANVMGSFQRGVNHIFIYSFGKRAHGNASNYPEIFADSLNASTINVIKEYLHGSVFDLNNLFETNYGFLRVSYLTVIGIVAVFSCMICLSTQFPDKAPFRRINEHRVKVSALAASTWFSVLAPLSWFVVFKGHSFVHTHMNKIAWHMPFTLLGFALVGMMASYMLSGIGENLRAKT